MDRRLIVGLGNPGEQYTRTRHNLGARVLLALRASLGQSQFRASREFFARVSRGDHLLAIPTTFMNESGRAVSALMKKERIPLDHLLIVHDDKDFVLGSIKLQKGRGAAGHRGVQSVIGETGSKVFWRLRLGIGDPPEGTPTDAYVLQPFTRAEERTLSRDVLPRATEVLRAWMDRSTGFPRVPPRRDEWVGTPT